MRIGSILAAGHFSRTNASWSIMSLVRSSGDSRRPASNAAATPASFPSRSSSAASRNGIHLRGIQLGQAAMAASSAPRASGSESSAAARDDARRSSNRQGVAFDPMSPVR